MNDPEIRANLGSDIFVLLETALSEPDSLLLRILAYSGEKYLFLADWNSRFHLSMDFRQKLHKVSEFQESDVSGMV